MPDIEIAGPAGKRLLATSPNFRDLGGLRAADGRRIRSGLFYRSGALDELDEADLLALAALNIGVCVDLRSDGERLKHPSRWPADGAPRTLAIAVATDIRALGREAAQYLVDHPDADGAAHLMRAIYRNMPLSCAPVLAALAAELPALRAPQALVLHCTAGKDRTGFIIAVLLRVLGVAMADIQADYLLTNHHYDAPRQDAKIAALIEELFEVRLDVAAMQAITSARLDYLDAAFAAIDERWGGVDAYLDAAGLDAPRRVALREALLE